MDTTNGTAISPFGIRPRVIQLRAKDDPNLSALNRLASISGFCGTSTIERAYAGLAMVEIGLLSPALGVYLDDSVGGAGGGESAPERSLTDTPLKKTLRAAASTLGLASFDHGDRSKEIFQLSQRTHALSSLLTKLETRSQAIFEVQQILAQLEGSSS